MADPVPSYDQVFNAVVTTLQGGGLTGTILQNENRYKNELEILRNYQLTNAAPYEVELILVQMDAESVEGRTYGEKYTIYKVQLRHLYTVQDEEEIDRIAKIRVEKIRTLIESNPAIFRIGNQVPLRTPETVSQMGRFVDREDSRYYETLITFQVEARRWL